MPYLNKEDKDRYNKIYAASHRKEKQLYDLKFRIKNRQKKQSILTQHIKIK